MNHSFVLSSLIVTVFTVTAGWHFTFIIIKPTLTSSMLCLTQMVFVSQYGTQFEFNFFIVISKQTARICQIFTT